MSWPGLHALGLAVPLVVASGCGQPSVPERVPVALPVDVLADTGRGGRLEVRRPRAAAWLARVTPSPPRVSPAPSQPLASVVSLPEPEPGASDADLPAPPELDVDPGLKPPLLRGPAPLEVPARVRRGWVELDVRVDEAGAVSDVRWAGGGSDSSRVGAATRCARAMRFHPALRAGRPVAVWCRQRFDFEGRP